MKSASKMNVFLVIVTMLVCVFSPGSNQVQSKTEETFQVSMTSPYIYQTTRLVFEIPIKTSILEDDWLTIIFPDILPVPRFYSKHDEYGNEYSAESDLRKNIEVNFLPLDPNKPLPVINYAENSLSFVMPRTLQIRSSNTTWLWITMSYSLPQKQCEGSFRFWHTSLDKPLISNIVYILDTVIKPSIENLSLVVSNPTWNEPTNWQFTCRTNERLTLYKNKDAVQINFGANVEFPIVLESSLVTVNDVPAYQVDRSSEWLIILLPITICENQLLKIIIWKEFGLKAPKKIGVNKILFKHSMKINYNSQYSNMEYYLSMEINPGKPFVTFNNYLTGQTSNFTLNWIWNPPYGSDSSIVELRWPDNFPLEENTTIYVNFNGDFETSGTYKNGIVSFSIKKEFETNQQISLKFNQQSRSRKINHFLNPSPGRLLFALRYHPDLEWIDFIPVDIVSGKVQVNLIDWKNRYVSQPSEVSFYFEYNENMNSICADGLYLTFSDNIVLPTNIKDNSVYFYSLSSSFTTKCTLINSHTLLIQTENKEDVKYNSYNWSLHIKEKAGVVNSADSTKKVSILLQSSQNEPPEFQAEISLVQIKNIPVISLEGGKLGANDWYVVPPTLCIQNGEAGSFININNTLFELPIHDIPLLEGQNIQYFSIINDFPHEGPLRSTYLKIKVDTIPVDIQVEKPALSWAITNAAKFHLMGKVTIPYTVEGYGNMRIIDQSLKIQNRMVLIKADGSFEDLVSLEKGKNEIKLEVNDWAGHQLKKSVHVYQGKGVILQIGSKYAWMPDKTITIDAPPLISQNRTFVPIRVVAEAFGATVTYRPQTKPPSVLIQRNKQTIELFVGNRTALVENNSIDLVAAPFIHQNRMMVPIRFLADVWNMETQWEATERVVAILFE